MSRYLVVAHETATSPRLIGEVKRIAAEDKGAQFVLVVPATPVRHLILRRSHDEDAGAVAGKRAQEAAAAFGRMGVTLAGTSVGAADPMEAIDEEFGKHPDYAGVVVSTLPAERSRWLKMHLPDRVREEHHVPVHAVEMPVSEVAQTMLP
ncbi:MAG: hypothetical protein ACLGIA_13430 [Actinomycetes bacterium]